LLLTPRAGLTPAAATVPVTPCPSHVIYQSFGSGKTALNVAL
jgi:hypothetical protein